MPHEMIPAGPYPVQGADYASMAAEETPAWKATKQILFVVFKWRRLILGLFLSFTVAAGIAMYVKPPIRKASAKILIKGDRLPLKISGMGTVGRSHSPDILRSEIQVLTSREVLLPVARKLLSLHGNKKNISEEELEAWVSTLAQSTAAFPLPESNVIEVIYLAGTSGEATKILGLIIDQYLEEQAAIQSGSTKTLKFYEQEKERTAADLREAEEQLRKWQATTQVVSVDEEIHTELRMLAEREKAFQQMQAEMEGTKNRIARLKSHLSTVPERLVTRRDEVKNPLISKLKGDLMAAEMAMQDILQRYTDKDRRVQEKREQIAFLKRELETAEKEGEIIGLESTGLNPLREVLERDLAGAQGLMIALVPQKEGLSKQIRESRERLAFLRENRIDVSRLSKLIDLRRETFNLYARQLEEARLGAALGKEQLANVALIEKPHSDNKTDHFKRIVSVLMVSFVGLALGLAVAFGAEFFNNSLRTQEDVEYYVGLPVLAAIPDLREGPLAIEGPSEREV